MLTTPGSSTTRVRLATKVRRGPGRPKKFGRPSRMISLTLPEDVIDRLEAIDVDVARAVVHLTERRQPPAAAGTNDPQVSSYGTHAVIVVPPLRKLSKFAGVELVPIGGNRALIALEGAHHVPQFELAVRDALERDDISTSERRTLHGIAEILQRARTSGTVTIAERTIIVLQAGRQRTSRGKIAK